MEKFRIALVCGYTNHKVRERLQLKKQSGFYKFLIKLFGLPDRVGMFQDTSPWIDNIIWNIEKRPDVELHVICPQIRLARSVQHFEMRGVHYHVISNEYTMLLRKTKNYQLWFRLQNIGRRVSNIVSQIKPDIVLLSGAENPSYSVAGLFIKDYPVYLLCQTKYDSAIRNDAIKSTLEKNVLNSTQYIGVLGREHYDYVKELNPNAVVFDFLWPSGRGYKKKIEGVEKKYDFINFAYKMKASKGFHDSVRALAVVKQSFPDVSMNLSGFCDDDTKKELDELIHQLGLENNVSFTGFFEKREDLFYHINEARFAVLPIKVDIISATIYQAMYFGLPVVTNITSGTPQLNADKESVLLANIDDVEMLAEKMLLLMKDSETAELLRNNAKEYLEKRAKAKEKSLDKLLADMHAIIDHYSYGKAIPNELLFNIEKTN